MSTPDVLLQFHDGLRNQCEKLHKKYELSRNYSLAIRAHLKPGPKGEVTHLLVLAGSTPTIVASLDFLLLIGTKDGKELVTNGLLGALKIVPRMQRTLGIVPLSDAIALRAGISKWKKASKDRIAVEIPDKYFDETHDITVRCILTGETLTQRGVSVRDIHKTKTLLQLRLSANALADPEVVELLQSEEEPVDYKKERRNAMARITATKRGFDSSFYEESESTDIPLSDIPKVIIP